MTARLLGAMVIANACTSPPHAPLSNATPGSAAPIVLGYQAQNPDDARLLAALQRAVAESTDPIAVEALVGAPAIINTAHIPGHRDLMKRVTITRLDNGGESIDVTHVRDVVYWSRPVPGFHNPPIAGLRWLGDHTVEVFAGYVLPP